MVLIIAEAGVNHDGSVDVAHQLVDVAADAGADAVKFQTFTANTLAADDAPKADYQRRTTDPHESSTAMLQRLELPRSAVSELADHARQRGLEFLSTPFDLDALDFLVEAVQVTRIKVSSGDLTHGVLLHAAARSGLPVIISTGMATRSEIADALDLIACTLLHPTVPPSRSQRAGAQASAAGRSALREAVTVLHCTSSYPAPMDQVNLRAMVSMAAELPVLVGYSDHTLGLSVPVAATALGATVIEKHFTLSRTGSGPDHEASLEPDELTTMVRMIRETQNALGSPVKEPTLVEAPTREASRRGIVAARDITGGTIVSMDDLAIRRPQVGGDPMDVFDLVGQPIAQAVRRGDPVRREVHEP